MGPKQGQAKGGNGVEQAPVPSGDNLIVPDRREFFGTSLALAAAGVAAAEDANAQQAPRINTAEAVRRAQDRSQPLSPNLGGLLISAEELGQVTPFVRLNQSGQFTAAGLKKLNGYGDGMWLNETRQAVICQRAQVNRETLVLGNPWDKTGFSDTGRDHPILVASVMLGAIRALEDQLAQQLDPVVVTVFTQGRCSETKIISPRNLEEGLKYLARSQEHDRAEKKKTKPDPRTRGYAWNHVVVKYPDLFWAANSAEGAIVTSGQVPSLNGEQQQFTIGLVSKSFSVNQDLLRRGHRPNEPVFFIVRPTTTAVASNPSSRSPTKK